MEGMPRPRADKRLSASKVVGSILGDTRQNAFESEMKAANYEAMMQRFQLRRLSSHTSPARKLNGNRVVLDKYLEGEQQPRIRENQRFSIDRFTRQLSRRVIQSTGAGKAAFVVLPWGRAATSHGLAMLGVYHFQVFYLPFAPVFFPSGSASTRVVDIVLEVVFILNVMFNFNAAYVENKAVVTSRRRIAWNYVHNWLAVDLISATPVQIVRQFVGSGSDASISPIVLHDSIQMAFRILRFSFGGRIFLRRALGSSDRLAAWMNYSRYSHLLGIMRLLWLVIIIAHYMACFWHLLNHDMPLPEQSVAEKYIANYYYAVTLIHGQGDISDHWGRNLFSTAIVLVGSVIVATVFGNVAMLVSNFNANTTNYQRKMEGVFATMDKMELPDRLRDRIQQYYAHVWTEYESLDGDLVRFQRELTHTLGLEVGLFKYMNLVNDIPFWAECSPDFIAQIVMTLVVRVYLPDDFVVRQGEICSEMFMVNRGICERTSKMMNSDDLNGAAPPDMSVKNTPQSPPRFPRRQGLSSRSLYDASAKEVYSGRVYPAFGAVSKSGIASEMLHPGQAFSEMSLLMNYRQPGSIRATSFVELCVLQRSTFQSIIARYPHDRRRVLKSMLKCCIEKQDVAFPWQELCRADTNQRQDASRAREFRPETMPWHVKTPAEAAQLLVQQIDVDLPDESIKFGFQSLDMLAQNGRGLSAAAGSSKRAVLSCDRDSGGNDAVMKMLQELAASVQQIGEDVRHLKERTDGGSATANVHDSAHNPSANTNRPARCESCRKHLDTLDSEAQPRDATENRTELPDCSPRQGKRSSRSQPRADQVAQLSWSHRGSTRRLDISPALPPEWGHQSMPRPETSDAETQTSTGPPAVESDSVMDSTMDSEALESPTPAVPPARGSRLRLFSLHQPKQSPPVHGDAPIEREGSPVQSTDAIRIIGEPNSRTASATALADQLWRRC